MKKQINSLFLLVLLLAGCSGENCIEADNFGYPKVVVPVISNNEDYRHLEHTIPQPSSWIDSNMELDGNPLVLVVKDWDYQKGDYNAKWDLSAWGPWFGSGNSRSQITGSYANLPICKFKNNIMDTNTIEAQLINAPCNFNKGVGLYALVTNNTYNPNISNSEKSFPNEDKSDNFHVGAHRSGYELYEIDKNGNRREAGGQVYNYDTSEDRLKYNNGKLYFKILDRYYNDSSGQYIVYVKGGVTQGSPDIFDYVTRLVKEFLFGSDFNDLSKKYREDPTREKNLDIPENKIAENGLVQDMFNGIIKNKYFRNAARALLTLFVLITALSYLSGNIELTKGEVISRVIKIGIITALLTTETSWDFFNKYLFALFIGGVEQIIDMLKSAGPGGSSLIGLMMSTEVLSKLISLLFLDPLGFIYIILFFIVFAFLITVLFKAISIYLTSLVAISIIIIIAPIFICMMLFDFTRQFFDNWLRQLISYSIQPIILFVGLAFMSMLVKDEIYKSLGFRVCKHSIFPSIKTSVRVEDLEHSRPDNSLFYWWWPDPSSKFSTNTVKIPIPLGHAVEPGTKETVPGIRSYTNESYCAPYECLGDRYIEFPYLDPVKDKERLKAIREKGQFVFLEGLIYIFIALYLLDKFNQGTVKIASFIAGTSMSNRTDLSSITENMPDARTLGSRAVSLGRGAAGAIGRGVRSGTKGLLNNTVGKDNQRKISDTLGSSLAKGAMNKVIGKDNQGKVSHAFKQMGNVAGKLNPFKLGDNIDSLRKKSLKKDALDKSKRSKYLAKRAAKETGLDIENIDKNAIKNYRENLANKFKRLDPKMSDKVAEDYANKAYKMEKEELTENFAKVTYGKEFNRLSDKEKENINKQFDESLNEDAQKAYDAQRFSNAYVNEYTKSSDQGVGLLGKKSTPLRKVEEWDNRRDKIQKKDLWQEQGRRYDNRGEELLKRDEQKAKLEADKREADKLEADKLEADKKETDKREADKREADKRENDTENDT